MSYQTSLVVIQSIESCNLNCSYCYLPNRSSKEKIQFTTIEQICYRLVESSLIGDKCTILWHSGEPMLLPISFYEHTHEIFKKNFPNTKLMFSFQTNGTKLTNDWCKFIKNNNIKISLSLDGTKDMNDRSRLNWSGKSSFDAVINAINLLHQFEIEFSIICVITKDSINSPTELINFFDALGIKNIGFSFEETEGANLKSSISITDNFFTFYEKIFSLNKTKELRVREFNKFNRFLKYKHRKEHNSQNNPLSILSFDTKGNFSTFSPELQTSTTMEYGDFNFGNVYDDKILDIFMNEKFIDIFSKIKAGVELCKIECDYFDVCGGGIPSNKFFENGSFASLETMECLSSIKAPFDVLIKNMEIMIQDI